MIRFFWWWKGFFFFPPCTVVGNLNPRPSFHAAVKTLPSSKMWESLHHSGFKQFHAATCVKFMLYNHTMLVTYVGCRFYLQLSKFKPNINPCKYQMMEAPVSARALVVGSLVKWAFKNTGADCCGLGSCFFVFFFLATCAVSDIACRLEVALRPRQVCCSRCCRILLRTVRNAKMGS